MADQPQMTVYYKMFELKEGQEYRGNNYQPGWYVSEEYSWSEDTMLAGPMLNKHMARLIAIELFNSLKTGIQNATKQLKIYEDV